MVVAWGDVVSEIRSDDGLLKLKWLFAFSLLTDGLLSVVNLLLLRIDVLVTKRVPVKVFPDVTHVVWSDCICCYEIIR